MQSPSKRCFALNVRLNYNNLKVITTTLLFIVLCLTVSGQIQVDFKFFDSCTDSVLIIPYLLSNNDTIVESNQNIAFVPKSNSYVLWVGVERGNNVCYHNLHLTIHQGYKMDTLYLNRIALCDNGALYSPDTYYYDCTTICNGELLETDKNGVIRAKGKFIDGWPKGKLKFFDGNGELISTEIHRNGRLKKIK